MEYLLLNTCGSFDSRRDGADRSVRPIEVAGIVLRRARPEVVSSSWLQTNKQQLEGLLTEGLVQLRDTHQRVVSLQTALQGAAPPAPMDPPLPQEAPLPLNVPADYTVLARPQMGFTGVDMPLEEIRADTPEVLEEVVAGARQGLADPQAVPDTALPPSLGLEQDPAALRKAARKERSK